MREGLLINYRLKVHGLPMRWQSEITAWEPPVKFVDVQTKGPYRVWHHTHRFKAIAPKQTKAIDEVEYSPPGGRWVNRLIVRPDIERIFAYRKKAIQEIFA